MATTDLATNEDSKNNWPSFSSLISGFKKNKSSGVEHRCEVSMLLDAGITSSLLSPHKKIKFNIISYVE